MPAQFRNLLEGVAPHEFEVRRRALLEAVVAGHFDCRLGDLRESIGPDFFDNVTLDAMHKRALKTLKGFPGADDWRMIATTKPVNDFRAQYGIRIGAYAGLDSKPDGGRYVIKKPTDEKASYQVAEYGNMEAFTFQAMANDELGMLGRWSERMGGAAGRNRNSFVFGDLLDANPTIYDGVALFHSNHSNNLGASTPLNYANLKAARKLIRNQTGLDGEPLNLEPDILIVHPDEEEDANNLIKSDSVMVGDRDTTATAQTNVPRPNFHRGRYKLIVTPYITSGRWYMGCTPSQCDTIEVGFLRGFENPQFAMERAGTGHHFETDSQRVKVHDVFGGTPVDFRWIVRGNAA